MRIPSFTGLPAGSEVCPGQAMRFCKIACLSYCIGGIVILLLPPGSVLFSGDAGPWLVAKLLLIGSTGLLLVCWAGRKFDAIVAQLRQLRAESEDFVSELRGRNDQLASAMGGIEAASRAKTRFLANMSHELRTPLNAIIGFSHVIAEEQFGPVGNPTYREYAQDIHDSGAHLLSLIKDILEMATIESGKLELKEQQVTVPDLLDSVARLMAQQVEKAGLRLDLEVAYSIPPILADERAIRQVLLNLLSNAVKFTPSGGHITVTAGLDPERRLLITVTDTGIGISKAYLEKVTQPFVQVHDSATASAGGSGLGLAITKELIELHGGSLKIQSKLGVGTSVCVELPVYRLCEPRFEELTVLDVKADAAPNFDNRLLLTFRGREIEVFDGSGTFVIGRNRANPEPLRCDLVVDDLRVSRPHARIHCIGGEFYLTDVSRRGTYIGLEDGTKITATRDNPVALPRRGVISLAVDPEDNGTNLIQFEHITEAPEQPVDVRAA